MNNTELIAQLREHDPMDGLYVEVPTSILEKAADALEAAEAAVIKKLAAGVVLRPYRADCFDQEVVVVRREDAETAIAAARVKALNEAAVLAATPVGTLSKSIRALIGANHA